MSNVFDFENIEDIDGVAITVERTPEFVKVARQLSDFVKDLPLDQPTNDRLVSLMVDQVQQAEKGAFAQGFRMGREYDGWEADHTEEVQQGNDLLS